jgi:hypothetical protein
LSCCAPLCSAETQSGLDASLSWAPAEAGTRGEGAEDGFDVDRHPIMQQMTVGW